MTTKLPKRVWLWVIFMKEMCPLDSIPAKDESARGFVEHIKHEAWCTVNGAELIYEED